MPWNTNDPLLIELEWMLTWSRWKLPPIFSVCEPTIRERVAPLEGVVDLALAGNVDTESEIIESDVFYAFQLLD